MAMPTLTLSAEETSALIQGDAILLDADLDTAHRLTVADTDTVSFEIHPVETIDRTPCPNALESVAPGLQNSEVTRVRIYLVRPDTEGIPVIPDEIFDRKTARIHRLLRDAQHPGYPPIPTP
jgi:hypothetical protein